jgi:hypothetical protein
MRILRPGETHEGELVVRILSFIIIDPVRELDVPRSPKTNDESRIDAREQLPDHTKGWIRRLRPHVLRTEVKRRARRKPLYAASRHS